MPSLTNKEIIMRLLQGDLNSITVLTDLLTMAIEVKEEDAALSKKLATKVRVRAMRLSEEYGDKGFYDLYNNALLYLAQAHKDFDAYLLYVEKNRDPEDRYYLPRRNKIYWLVQKMQRLIDDELDILSISMPPGTGKAQPLYSKILTPDGFVRMGDIKVGTKVISGNGNVCNVIGVYPQGKKKVYELTFDDGTKVRCSDEHLWKVQTRDDRNKARHGEKGRYRIIELKDMLGNYKIEGGKRLNYSIDYVPKIELREKNLLIHPYVMGALLGDGSLSIGGTVGFTNVDKPVLNRVKELLPNGYSLTKVSEIEYRIVEGFSERDKFGRFTKCHLRKELERLGLFGKKSDTKFIPEEYLTASYEQRLELLRGLMDTDGSADKTACEYTTVSKELADGVVELAHSLGCYASVSEKKTSYVYKGERKNGKIAYRVIIQFESGHDKIFCLDRKNDRYQPKREVIKRFVKDIAYIGEEECQCIMVDDPCHLYITDGYVITHNTTLGEFFLSFVMGHYPNTPNLMSSHSGYMTRMFYDAVLNIISSNEYCWSDVFPDVVFESNNAKEETINLGRWQPFKTLTCRSIRGSLTGVTRCEGFLYVDDLVSGIEEALSIDRLDKLYGEYTTDLKSRKKKRCKEIHIATRWSVHDVIGRLERQYENDDRAEFIAVPDIDPITGMSNFDYDYDTGFDVKYFEDMAASMDDVSYRCLYKSDPIEREGILYHPDELRRYIGGLPAKDPDAILGICDTKDTGTDYNFLGIFYKYGETYYLEDLVFKNIDPGTLDELNANMLIKHHVQQCQFESNKEGSRTANKVEELVKAKGGRCHITKKYTTQNKETKIIVNSPWVKEHVVFKDFTEYDSKSDYGVMMSYLCSYTQLGKNKHDDAPDTLAMFALYVDSLLGSRATVTSRRELGI